MQCVCVVSTGFWGPGEVSAGPLEYVKGSVTSPGDLDQAFRGAAGVIHTGGVKGGRYESNSLDQPIHH